MLEFIESPKKLLFTERAFFWLSVVLAAYQAWISRHSMMSDGISYLDIGDAYLHGDWKAAINGYWSPLYSVFLGSAMRFLKPSMRWEFPVVHLVNFIIFVLALVSFRGLLRTAVAKASPRGGENSEAETWLPEGIVVSLSYLTFLWSLLVLDDLILVTPDLLVAGLLFLLGKLLLDLRTQLSFRRFLLFGLICGIAYLTKGIMFPMSFVFLAVLFFSGAISMARLRGVLVAGIGFLLVASPFILSLSKAKGRLTYGDTGKLAYAALVSPGTPQTNWQGEPVGSGTPLHPTRKLLNEPLIFEYSQPVEGTYPPWYDPSYWNEGVRPTWRLRSQLRVVAESFLAYGAMLSGYAPLITAILFFLFLGGKSGLESISENWPLLIIPLVAAGIYALVFVKTRYLAGFAVLFFVALVTRIRLPKNSSTAVPAYLGFAVILLMFISLASQFGNATYQALAVGRGPMMNQQADVVEGLRGMGLHANEKVAVVGEGLTAYWARLGRFKIVAEISDPSGKAFWGAPPEMKERAYECVRRTNARAIIVWNPPELALTESWRRIGGTQYYAYVFPE
jgi:hypothetical protein